MIELQHVSKNYGTTPVLHDVNLAIEAGEFVSLVGQSGVGKSTLIKLLTREEVPSSGRIYVAGREISELSRSELPIYRRKIGIIFQDFRLLNQKTVAENIAYALEVCGASSHDIKRRVPKILELVGLEGRQKNYPPELSGGEQQRVAIARALIHSPKVLIADEPTGNLDPVNTWEIIDLLYRINQLGTLIILATHNKQVVDRLHRRVIELRGGKIVRDEERGSYVLQKAKVV
ncbi:MAG TPA: cell division ATP-binding protein FtsE [Patescibacteria group bacterium]